MCRNRKFRLPAQLFLHRFNDVVRHERFSIVLADVSARDVAGFATQITGELTAVVVLHDDRVPRVFQNVKNRLAVQRHEPANLELVRRNTFSLRISQASSITPLVDPQPINVTSASRGPHNSGGETAASIPTTFRMRFSIMARRLIGLVNSSLINTPSSSCSSVAAVWMWPGTPGMARGEIPLSVIL